MQLQTELCGLQVRIRPRHFAGFPQQRQVPVVVVCDPATVSDCGPATGSLEKTGE